MTIAPAPYPPVDGTQPCAHLDPELFFPGDDLGGGLYEQPAARHCRRCPFIDACLAHALTHDVVGIWGGTSTPERRRIRKQHDITPARVVPLTVDELTERVAELNDGVRTRAEIAAALGVGTATVSNHFARRRAQA